MGDTGPLATVRRKRVVHVATTLVALLFAAVFVIAMWLKDGDHDAFIAAPPAKTMTAESKSALPTDQDMIEACKNSLEVRMARNPTTPGEVLWNTAEVAPSKDYPGMGLYDVAGTGTLVDVVQTPFAFTCLVEFGPPTVAVDNGFTLWP